MTVLTPYPLEGGADCNALKLECLLLYKTNFSPKTGMPLQEFI